MPSLSQPVVPAGRMASMAQPVIDAGGGLVLRPFVDEDAAAVFEAFADPAISHWHGRTTVDLAEAQSYLELARSGWIAEKGANWAVVRAGEGPPEAGTFVGRTGLSYVDLASGIVELSYWVLPQHRGEGVARTAGAALARWCFEVLGVHRVELMHSTANAASCAVAGHLGFAPEGVLRSYLLHDDGWHDMHLHSLLATDPRPGSSAGA